MALLISPEKCIEQQALWTRHGFGEEKWKRNLSETVSRMIRFCRYVERKKKNLCYV